MRYLFALIMLLCSGTALAATNDVLLNLRDPAATSPLFPTLPVKGPADGGTNVTVKLPVLPCVANAADPVWPEGSIVPCSVTLSGGMRMSGGASGGDGAILDGVSAAIRATVRDYLNSNPLAVVLTDTNGDPYLSSGGTQYNQGTAATDTDTMTMTGCVRADAAAVAAGVADGDRARCIVDSVGRIWTRVGTIDGGTITSITNPVAVTQSGVWTTGRTWTLSSGTDSVAATISNAFLLDATFTGRFATAYLDADAIVNQTTTVMHGHGYMYNGATWDRMRGTIAGGLLVDVSDAFLLDATFTARINTLGQKTMAASTPVVLASDQTSIPVAATVSNAFLLDATFTGRFPAAYVDADAIANQTTTAIHGQGYFYNGTTWDRMRGTIAGGLLVNISNASLAVTGTFFQATQPVSIAATVTVQGAKTNNNAAPGATNVGVLPCVATAVAPTHTEGNQVGCSTNLGGAQRTIEQNFVSTANDDGSCPSGAASFTVAASNASRTWIAIWGSPANTDDVFVKLGTTATSSDARIAPGQPINFVTGRIYTGRIDAIPASGTQAVCVMELN